MVGRRTFTDPEERRHGDTNGRDLESGARKTGRFKDAVELAMAERITVQLKRQLIEGVDIEQFEKFRKSDEAVSYDAHIPMLRSDRS